MRFICVLRTPEDLGFPPPELHEGMGKLAAEADNAGVLVDSAGLLPSDSASVVSVADGELTITHGTTGVDNSSREAPLGAYAIYEVVDRDEVTYWVKRFMDLHRQTWPGWHGDVEIRQVFGPEGGN